MSIYCIKNVKNLVLDPEYTGYSYHLQEVLIIVSNLQVRKRRLREADDLLKVTS